MNAPFKPSFAVTWCSALFAACALGQQPAQNANQAGGQRPATSALKRLDPESQVWLDTKYHRVVVGGEVVFREGPLELFACPKGTKEHESIVACPVKAYLVHAALLALGAEPGHPVAYQPAYRSAEGPEIEVVVYWTDAQGKSQRARGEDWVRNARTKKPLDQPWVFAGSGFYKDEATGENHYMAESGDLICVSNFPTAMLDLPIKSSQDNDALLFECFTERIPPVGTKITLTLTPKTKEGAKDGSAAAATADGSRLSPRGKDSPDAVTLPRPRQQTDRE